MGETVSVILTVYNKENFVDAIFSGIVLNASDQVKEIIVILDGCTDKSEEALNNSLYKSRFPVKIIHTPNLNETLANNVGLKASTADYSIIVQDDCLIQEYNFDQRLLRPFKRIPNLLAVSGRDAVDTELVNGKLNYCNVGGADVGTERNIFSIRDAVNRGPLMLHNQRLAQLGYLDESFAPLNSDDVDLSIRGYKEYGYLVGSYVVDFYSPPQWGTVRSNPESNFKHDQSEQKNMRQIVERHYDFIVGAKHSMDVVIEEEDEDENPAYCKHCY